MITDIIEAYRIDNEELRLQSTLARKVEYISTIETLMQYYKKDSRIIDIACGTGIYSVFFARMGLQVTSIDIVSEHIDCLLKKISTEKTKLDISAAVGDACDLSMCDNNLFDFVLCMGPLYHLIKKEDRDRCLDECIRVAAEGATFAFSYISPFSVFPCVARGDSSRISKELIEKIIIDKQIEANDACCFWTDNFYFEPSQIESYLKSKGFKIIDHLATDGQSIAFQSTVNNFTSKEFELWMMYHRKVCRIPAIIGTSNHGLVIAKKW